MCSLIIIVWAETAKNEERTCQEHEGSETSARALSSFILIIVYFV
jgi:hypothetical protein